jgi:acyl-CoA dehydrogenase
MTVAKQVLRDYSPVDDLWPSGHLPKRLAAARQKYAAYLDGGADGAAGADEEAGAE